MSNVAQDQFKELDKVLFFSSRLRKLGVLCGVGSDVSQARRLIARCIVDNELSLTHTTYGRGGHATFGALFFRAFGETLEHHAKGKQA